MAVSTQWQLAHDAARRYHDILVPVILRPAADLLVQAAAIHAGKAVLDIGCATGTATRLAAQAAGATGRVIGLDLNAGMLAVAKTLPAPHGAAIEWLEGNAESLELPDRSIDVVLCAQTLQFVPDRAAALREMRRVLRPGGRVAIAVWSRLEASPYFVSLVQAVSDAFGEPAAAGIKAVFGLHDRARVRALLEEAGFDGLDLRTECFTMALPPLREFIPRHLSATPLAALFASAPQATQAAIVDNVLRDLDGRDASARSLATHIALGVAP